MNLAETRSERRQIQLVRILRALAKPDLVTYQQQEFEVDLPFYLPCPAGGAPAAEIDRSKPYIEAEPACANPGDTITVKGYKFAPNSTGPLNFIPPSTVKLSLGTIETDAQGEFTMTAKLPKRDSDQVQHLRATTRLNVGAPQLSRTALETWDKIVETVFLALLATTIGTLLAVPLSFFAALQPDEGCVQPGHRRGTEPAAASDRFPFGSAGGRAARDLTNQVTSLKSGLNLAGMIVGPGAGLPGGALGSARPKTWSAPAGGCAWRARWCYWLRPSWVYSSSTCSPTA